MTTNGKKKPTAPPLPIVLILTLQDDGNGTLLTKRGELASLSSFTYRGMKEIVAAIEYGAAHLIEVEQNPPPKELPTAAVRGTQPVTTSAPQPEAAIENPPEADSEASDEANQAENATVEPLNTPPAEETAQLNLF